MYLCVCFLIRYYVNIVFYCFVHFYFEGFLGPWSGVTDTFHNLHTQMQC